MAFQFPNPNVQDTVINPITGSEYVWIDPPGKWVVKASSTEISDIIYEGDSPPDPRGDYKLWYSTDTLELYFWYEDVNGVGAWVPTSVPITTLEELTEFAAQAEVDIDQLQYKQQLLQNTVDQLYLNQQQGNYVKKTGDTMTGNLVMDDASILVKNGELDFTQTGTTAELTDPGNRFSTIKSAAPIDSDSGSFDYSTAFGLQVSVDAGNTFKNKFKVNNRNGDIVEVSGGTGPTVKFGENFPGNQNGYESGYAGGVIIKGIPTPAVSNPEPTLAVNKQYVDTRDEFLQQEIIELEEEIEALAPTTERGAWVLTLAGTALRPGQFTMFSGTFGSPGSQPNGKIQDVKSIWFNELDTDGTPHGFAGVEEGDLLELFVDGSPEYGLWSVVGTPQSQGAGQDTYWAINVDFQRTLEDDTSFGPGDLCRLKIFKAPSGGNASEFVRKDGDEMSGPLKFETAQNGSNFTVETGQARVAFENTTSGGTTRKVNLFQPGAENSVVSSGNLMAKGHLYTTGHIYGWGGSNSNSYGPRIFLGSSYGAFKYTNTEVATWNNNGISYYGSISQDNHITNKEYVDNKIEELLAKIEELEMASGAPPDSYSFTMETKQFGSNTAIGNYINSNQITSCNNDSDKWAANHTHSLHSEQKFIYVCFGAGWQLNPRGYMQVIKSADSNNYVRDDRAATFAISNVEVCPPDKSSGKNIYRAQIQIDAHKESYSAYWPNWGSGDRLSLTFTGGSVTKNNS